MVVPEPGSLQKREEAASAHPGACVMCPAWAGLLHAPGDEFGLHRTLADISISIAAREITALIGPSGCGKSTFLRCLNRMNDTIPGARAVGRILLDGADIYAPNTNLADLRRMPRAVP